MSLPSVPDYLRGLEERLGALARPPVATVEPKTSVAEPVYVPAQVINQVSFPTPTQAVVSVPTFGLPPQDPSQKKFKFMLVGTHCQQVTGYSKVTYGIIKQLAKVSWLSVSHFAFQKLGNSPPQYRPYPPNIDVIDAAALEKPAAQGFGYSALPDAIRRKKPNVVMIYNDMVVITKFLEAIRESGIPRTFKIWLYVDQVYNTQLQPLLDVINRDGDRIFVFSKYWKDCLKGQGITRPINILRHGFDDRIFSPMKREDARKAMNLPNDIFLFLSLNRNQPRKRYDLLIMAFVELLVKYPTKPIFLLCVCDKGEKGGWPLFEIFAREIKMRGVPMEQYSTRLMLSTTDMSFPDEHVNVFYNAADAGVSTAEGEGWGLCNFEQMGVGVPQIVPDIGGFKDFCTADNSVMVKPSSRYYLPVAYSCVGGEATPVDAHEFCLAMEKYVNDSELKAKHGKAARETVIKNYKWEDMVKEFVEKLDNERKEQDD